MGDGHGVEPDDLHTGAYAIRDAVAPATRIELQHGGAAAYGEFGPSEAFERFCTTWQLALDLLDARAQSAQRALHAAAGTYRTDDDAARDSFRGMPLE